MLGGWSGRSIMRFGGGPLSDSENARDRKFRILLATGDNRKEAHNRQIKIKLIRTFSFYTDVYGL